MRISTHAAALLAGKSLNACQSEVSVSFSCLLSILSNINRSSTSTKALALGDLVL